MERKKEQMDSNSMPDRYGCFCDPAYHSWKIIYAILYTGQIKTEPFIRRKKILLMC